ncbi:hypothetical protein GCM10010334_46020 [Streptomyces finlayi]|uniref:Uncharacterized protein n=1 Tax=Streptomyces finlayi TaxID=67296 RepID=A0A918X0Q2_9ACTN|nr:hypothetical protein GCM10010334_46020 [Streptomyces finlayi]
MSGWARIGRAAPLPARPAPGGRPRRPRGLGKGGGRTRRPRGLRGKGEGGCEAAPSRGAGNCATSHDVPAQDRDHNTPARGPARRGPAPSAAPTRHGTQGTPYPYIRSKERLSSQSVTAASNAANSTLAMFA